MVRLTLLSAVKTHTNRYTFRVSRREERECAYMTDHTRQEPERRREPSHEDIHWEWLPSSLHTISLKASKHSASLMTKMTMKPRSLRLETQLKEQKDACTKYLTDKLAIAEHAWVNDYPINRAKTKICSGPTALWRLS